MSESIEDVLREIDFSQLYTAHQSAYFRIWQYQGSYGENHELAEEMLKLIRAELAHRYEIKRAERAKKDSRPPLPYALPERWPGSNTCTR